MLIVGIVSKPFIGILTQVHNSITLITVVALSMWDKHIKVISRALVNYTECHKILTHRLENYRHARKNRTSPLPRLTLSRLLVQRVALQNNCSKCAILSSEHTGLTELESQKLLSQLSNRFSFLFYSIVFNPHFWTLIYSLETSFTDELIAFNTYNLSVIFHTTQCLLSQVCI